MNNLQDLEKAFLEWLNLLDVQESKIVTIESLKDGVTLLKVLHKMYFHIISKHIEMLNFSVLKDLI